MKPDSVQFAGEVASIVSQIPAGYVLSYGDVAALASFPSHARLVGKILGNIGMSSSVPCHRVVNADGRPAPHWNMQRKLLEAEGVEFKPNGNVIMQKYRWNPPIAE